MGADNAKVTEPVPVPASLLAELRDASRARGMWLHNAVEEALRLWLRSERRQRHHRHRPQPRHEQLTGEDIRTLVKLHLTRSEAREIARFTLWLRTAQKRDVEFWGDAIRRAS